MDASRFDTFTRTLAVAAPRRRVLKVLAGLGLGGVLLRRAAEPVSAAVTKCPGVDCAPDFCMFCEITADKKRCACGCEPCVFTGITGGGAVSLDGGAEAHLSLFATRTPTPGTPETFTVVGRFTWFDAADDGLTLEGIVTDYGPQPDVEGGREASGWITVDGKVQFPFVLRAVDAGPPGGGQDTVALWAGDAVFDEPTLAGTPPADYAPSGFSYSAQGTLVSGDLQLVRFASGTSGANAALATPAS